MLYDIDTMTDLHARTPRAAAKSTHEANQQGKSNKDQQSNTQLQIKLETHGLWPDSRPAYSPGAESFQCLVCSDLCCTRRHAFSIVRRLQRKNTSEQNSFPVKRVSRKMLSSSFLSVEGKSQKRAPQRAAVSHAFGKRRAPSA